MPVTVHLLVFSGRPDPEFALDDAQAHDFAARAAPALATVPVPADVAMLLGYRGFALDGGEAVGLPPQLEIGHGLVISEDDAGRTAWVDAGGCEEWLKQRARDAGLGALLGDGAVAPGPRPRSPALRQGLVADALGYASDRLDELVDPVLRDVPSFAAAAGAGGFVDDGSVASRLAAARAELGLLAADLDAANLIGAATHLGAALHALDLAATSVGGLRLGPLLAGTVGWGGVAAKGLAAQLGLPATAPDRIDVDGAAFVFELKAPGASLIPAGILRFDAATLGARLSLDAAAPGFAITLALKGLEAGVGGPPIASLLGGASGSVAADVVVGVDLVNGLTVAGGASKRVVLPARAKTGPLDLREIAVEIPSDRRDTIDLGTTLAVDLGGVIQATVDGAGLRVRIDTEAAGGNLPLSTSLKAPTGIGLTLDAGLVRGGGFLDERAGGFGGALQLRLGPVEVKAVGLLTLEPSFALVVVMSVEFLPPIDLSFGFTLNAVGGVVGIEHRLDSDALRAQLTSGALDHILFPPDPVAAAPAILDTLEQVFPADPGSVVIGPMVEVGWGRPVSFLTAQLGVILSLPDTKIVIIGRVRIALPAPQLPIVDLRATVYGEITPDHLLILVSLNGSRIAGFTVGGDIGLLLRYGGSPEFAISAGGFHPRYDPPKELTGMQRLSMDLSPPAILQLRSESYFALTSNSVQLGARVEMGADLGVASISGHFAFDALVVFSPRFMFVIDLSIGITVRALGATLCGVSVTLHVEGPGPWRAEGHAEVEILWWTVNVDVGPFTWGDEDNPPPAPADPRALAHAAMHRNPGAWQALVPPDADRVVRLKPAAPSDTDVTVHPMGLFDVRQHAIPLETVITRVGPNPVPEGLRRVHFGVPLVDATPAGALSDVTDAFSAGTFLDLSDDEKLARPGFEPMPAGARIRPPGETVDAGAARHAELRYETFVCDDESLRGVRGSALLDTFFARSAATTLASGAAGRSELRASVRYVTAPDPIVLADAGEVLAVSKVTVTPVDAAVRTYTHAAEELRGDDVQLARLGVA